ncbi:MAG TPA: hypothetical protein VGE38_11015 [Nocardioides sp.]|uniref:hypothetical protein n=1 Tax=Nocardioides sp. TaxID=35761 RepID=UPI002EDA6AAA
MDERPMSLRLAVQMLWALLVVGAVTVLLIVLREDDLIRTWAEGNRATREILERQGLEAVKDGSVQPPQFVPVAVTMYVVLAALVWVLGVFLRNGFEWARSGITVVLVFSGVAAVGGMRVGQPTLFDVCTVVCLVLVAALLVALWHPRTTAYIHADLDGPADDQAGVSAPAA